MSSRASSSRGFKVGDCVSYKSSNGYVRTGVIAEITEAGASVDEGHPYKSWIEFKYLEPCLPTSTCFQASAAFKEQQSLLGEYSQPNLLKSTPTQSPYCDAEGGSLRDLRNSQESQSTTTSATTTPSQENFNLSRWNFPVPGPAAPDCEPDLTTQNQHSGLKHCDALQTRLPISSSSKILQGLSVVDYEQFSEDSEWSAIVGTIHKSYQLRNWERRRRGKDFSLLPTPTTYAKGSGKCRPAGATPLEQSLRQFIAPGDKLQEAVPGSAKKVLEENQIYSLEKIDKETERHSRQKVLEEKKFYSLEKSQRKKAPKQTTSHIQVTSSSSGSLYRYLKNIKLKSGEIASYPRIQEVRDPDNLKHWYWGYSYKVLEDGEWISRSLSVPRVRVRSVQRMIENHAPVAAIKAALKVLEDREPVTLERISIPTPPPCLEKVLEDSSTDSLERNQLTAKPDCLEKVLEDNQTDSLEKFPASGSLYRYLKNKKLKSGAIASYPRVKGARNPNNPDHWYWGYSYEVLEDGSWKGRSLSVPKRKVLAVQAMIDSHEPVAAIKVFIRSN